MLSVILLYSDAIGEGLGNSFGLVFLEIFMTSFYFPYRFVSRRIYGAANLGPRPKARCATTIDGQTE